jgi:hypothetical protein
LDGQEFRVLIGQEIQITLVDEPRIPRSVPDWMRQTGFVDWSALASSSLASPRFEHPYGDWMFDTVHAKFGHRRFDGAPPSDSVSSESEQLAQQVLQRLSGRQLAPSRGRDWSIGTAGQRR